MAKFRYSRITQFYETDAMGIIHHANYILLLEEARLQFLRSLHQGQPEGDLLKDINFPLVSCHVDYKKPIRFNQEVMIDYEVTTDKARLVFDYALSTKSFDKPVAFGKTVHVAFDMKKQMAIRMPESILKALDQKG